MKYSEKFIIVQNSTIFIYDKETFNAAFQLYSIEKKTQPPQIINFKM